MSSILSNYSESTKSMSTTLFIALGLILITTFVPAISNSIFKSIIFKICIFACLGYTTYVVIVNTVPIIKTHKIDLLRDSLSGIRKSISYNTVLILFILVLAYHVLFI